MNKLRPKQKEFIKNYIESGGNGRRSYMKAYGTDNVNSADACASELLSKTKVANEIERRTEKEIDINYHLGTLERKLRSHSENPKFTREELSALRLALECGGVIGGKGINVNIDLRSGDTCPTCKRIYGGVFSQHRESTQLETLMNKRLRTPQIDYIPPTEKESLGYVEK